MTTFASEILDPLGLAFDSDGDLFAGSLYRATVSEYTPAGQHQYFALGVPGPWGLAFGQDDTLFATSYEVRDNVVFGRILKFLPDGSRTLFFERVGAFNGLTLDDAGNLYATGASEIIKITPEGIDSIYASGLDSPVALAFARGIPGPNTTWLLLGAATILFIASK